MGLIEYDLLDTSVLHRFCMLSKNIITPGRPKDLKFLKSIQILVNSPITLTFVPFLNSSPPCFCVSFVLLLREPYALPQTSHPR
jgi:hypothetical protein